MALFDKVSLFAKNISDKTNDAIETTRLNGRIAQEKTEIGEQMKLLGEFLYGKHAEGTDLGEQLNAICQKIDEHKAQIREAQRKIEEIKTENEEAPAQAASAMLETTCSSCGAKNPEGTKFCRECGAKLDPPVAELKCPACGATLPLGSKFCTECGTRL